MLVDASQGIQVQQLPLLGQCDQFESCYSSPADMPLRLPRPGNITVMLRGVIQNPAVSQ